jgi:hypothetical protein
MPRSRELAELATSYDSGGLLGFRNRIINGAMMIDQRNAGASVTPASLAFTYTLDRWAFYCSQSSKLTAQQNAGSITPPAGFTNYLGVTSSSAYSITSSDQFVVRQYIEGFNTADLGFGTANASTVTLSFWVRSSLTGTFGGSLQNSNASRSYAFSYTISAANTWEQKTVTISGDTTGTWIGATNGTGLIVTFSLGVGSNFSGTAGSWVGAGNNSATGATSVVGTNGATFYITGVQLEAGSVATPFERRDYGRELMMCQRYLPAFNGNGTAAAYIGSAYSYATNTINVLVPFPVQTRVAPTGVSASAATILAYQTGASNTTSSLISFGAASTSLIASVVVAATATTGSAGAAYFNTATGQILFTGCEL